MSGNKCYEINIVTLQAILGLKFVYLGSYNI